MANGGNMKKAMIDAGYSETYADKNARYLFGIIGQEIKTETEPIRKRNIKKIAEIQEWWSEIMDNQEERTAERLKASEYLAKSQGGFVDNVNVSGQVNNPFDGVTTEQLKKLIGGG